VVTCKKVQQNVLAAKTILFRSQTSLHVK